MFSRGYAGNSLPPEGPTTQSRFLAPGLDPLQVEVLTSSQVLDPVTGINSIGNNYLDLIGLPATRLGVRKQELIFPHVRAMAASIDEDSIWDARIRTNDRYQLLQTDRIVALSSAERRAGRSDDANHRSYLHSIQAQLAQPALKQLRGITPALRPPTNSAQVYLSERQGAPIAIAVNAVPNVSLSIVSNDQSLTVTEGSFGSSPRIFTFTVTRTGDTSAGATVTWAASGSGAAPADANDFQFASFPSGSLLFLAGETSKKITVNVNSDLAPEPNESFSVTLLSSSDGAAIANPVASNTIVDDDYIIRGDGTRVTVVATTASRLEGTSSQGGITPFVFTIQRHNNLTRILSQIYSISPLGENPATSDDFQSLARSSVTFLAGETSKTVTINVVADGLVEADEGFAVLITSDTGEQRAGAVGWIRNDDGTSLALTAVDSSKAEGSANTGWTPYKFLVSRTGNLSGSSTANWSISGTGVNAAAASDFRNGQWPTGNVSFLAGQSSKEIVVDVNPDFSLEPDETFQVTLAGATGATITGATSNGILVNDEPVLEIRGTSSSNKHEGNTLGEATRYSFSVVRRGDLTGQATVKWAVTGTGSNPADARDFSGNVLPSGLITFAPGQSYQVINYYVESDALVEADETCLITLSGATGASLSTSTLISTIENDESFFSIAAKSKNKTEGTAAGGVTPYVFTITRTGDLRTYADVGWVVGDVLGLPSADPNSDFQLTTGGRPLGEFVAFLPGATSQDVTVNILADSQSEPDEWFAVQLQAASNAWITPREGLNSYDYGLIIDDDSPTLAITATAANKAERTISGGITPFVFTVTRTGNLTAGSSVNWAVTGSGAAAAAASDFLSSVLPSGVLTFLAGEASKQIAVNVQADAVVEKNESFALTLSAPTNAVLTTAQAVGTIANDDLPVITLSVSVANVRENGSTSIVYTFQRTGSLAVDYDVNLIVGGTAAFSSDYTQSGAASFSSSAGRITFAPGSATASLTLNPRADNSQEADETLSIQLATSSTYTVGTPSAVVATILNDDIVGTDAGERLTGRTVSGYASFPEYISGLGGNDTITGGSGIDILVGGSGSDVFVYSQVSDSSRSANDQIADFASSVDKIDLSSLDPVPSTTGVNEAFAWLGSTREALIAPGRAGYVSAPGGGVTLFANTGSVGSTTPDFRVDLPGVTALAASNIIL